MIAIVMPGDLDVHLDRGDAVDRAGDFEVHLAERVFQALDVGQDRALLAVAARDPSRRPRRAARAERPRRSARARPHTDAIDDEPFDSSTSLMRRSV